MKRDFLRNLDLGDGARLPDAAIEAIMAEHGRTVTPLQESVTALTGERDGLQTQLTDAQSRLSGIHNGYAEKLGEIQTDIAVIKNDIKTLYKQRAE